MRFLRWGYVLPRLVVVTTLVLTVHFGLDPLLKWALVSGGEAAVGAKVDVAELTTSLRAGELVIRELAVANPQKPMRNLFALGDARLQLDVTALTHNRLVVRDGTITGLVFDSERSTSGALPDAVVPDTTEPSALDPWLTSAGEYGAEWLDGLSERLSADFTDQLQAPKLAQELQDRWPAEYARLKGEVQSLQDQAKALKTTIKELQKNPLRNVEGLQQLHGQLTAAQQQLAIVRTQLESLPRQVEADRQAVLTAREHDEQFLRQRLQFNELNREQLTQTLLGDEAASNAAYALDWIRWARQQVPKGPAKPVRSRGTNVLFTAPQPTLLVEQVLLETTVSLNGQPLELVGMLTNATNEPQLWHEPLRLDLHGEGLAVELTLDHRREVPEEHLHVACESLTLPGRRLGKSEKLTVALAPGAATLHANVWLNGDKLTGEIRYAQASTQLTASADGAKREQLATLLNQAFAGINHLEAHICLSGTLEKPVFDLESNLGPELAAGINSAARDWLAQRTAAFTAQVNEKVDAQLAQLTAARAQAEQELFSQLGEQQQQLSQLASTITGGLPIPQLSQKFDFGTLRK